MKLYWSLDYFDTICCIQIKIGRNGRILKENSIFHLLVLLSSSYFLKWVISLSFSEVLSILQAPLQSSKSLTLVY
jgi:hypothetical protein